MKFLVINENEQAYMLPYAERYRIFATVEKAVAAAAEIGWRSMFGLGINTKAGVANVYRCGTVNVIILPLEEQ